MKSVASGARSIIVVKNVIITSIWLITFLVEDKYLSSLITPIIRYLKLLRNTAVFVSTIPVIQAMPDKGVNNLLIIAIIVHVLGLKPFS